MREHLIAFIEAVRHRMNEREDAQAMIELGGRENMRLSFGRQYADPSEVILWPIDGAPEALPIAVGVAKFLAHYGLDP